MVASRVPDELVGIPGQATEAGEFVGRQQIDRYGNRFADEAARRGRSTQPCLAIDRRSRSAEPGLTGSHVLHDIPAAPIHGPVAEW